MADTDIVQVIAEARIDARSLSEFIWKPIDFMVTRRLAPPINTLNFYIDKLENYTAGLDAKTVQVNAELTTKANQAKASIDATVDDIIADSLNRTALVVQAVKDDINNVLNQTIDNASFNIIDSFELGATLNKRTDALRHSASGKLYRWGGVLPKVVPTSSTPTSSGGFGANAWLEVSDVALRQELSSDNGYRSVANQMAANAYGVPAPMIDVELNKFPHTVADYFDGFFWGSSGGKVYKSKDGDTWDFVCNAPTTFFRIMPTNDGEVIANDSITVRKSSGWGTGTVAWNTVLTNSATSGANFRAWGFDGNGSKFIITHYGNNAVTDWLKSRYVWISTDMGNTFEVVYDTDAQYPGKAKDSHLHAACYDPWLDRFWFSEGHGEMSGMYWSDNNGVTWSKLVNDGNLRPAPTVMIPTDFGIVCGTDSTPDGVYVMTRARNPETATIKLFGRWRSERTVDALNGFADRGYRDADTGIVYLGFTSANVNMPPVIMACGSGGAAVVYEPKGTVDAGQLSRFSSVVVGKGILLGNLEAFTGAGGMKGSVSKYTTNTHSDLGNILSFSGGHTTPSSNRIGFGSRARGVASVAIGKNSSAGAALASLRNIAIGVSATTSGTNTIALGYNSSSVDSNSLAIGNSATASTSFALAIGDGAKANGYNSIAIGKSTTSADFGVSVGDVAGTAASAVSVGRSSKALGTNSVAIGNGAESSSIDSISIGRTSKSTGQGSVSVGNNTSAHTKSTAFGEDATAATIGSIAVGYAAKAIGLTAYSISIGYEASVDTGQAIAVGKSSEARNFGIAIGENSQGMATAGIAIGRNAKNAAGQIRSIAIGQDANAGATESLVIGAGASTTGSQDAIAFGHGASATGWRSVAIGHSTSVTVASRVSIGDRDLESTRAGGAIFLKSPDGTAYKITVSDEGELTVATV